MRSTDSQKITLIADTHLQDGTPSCRKDNDYYYNQLEKFEWCLAQAPIMIHAGDFFHRPQPSHRLLCDVIYLIKNSGTKVMVTPGQHDIIGHNIGSLYKTGLGVLGEAGVVEVLPSMSTSFKVFDQTVLVHSAPYGEAFLEPDPSYFSILSMHRMILGPNGEGSYNGFVGENCVQFLTNHKFNVVVCGDNHKTFAYCLDGRYFINTGSMVRLTRDQKDHKPVLGILEIKPDFRISCSLVQIPHKDDVFYELDEEFSSAADINPAIQELIEALKLSGSSLLNFEEVLVKKVLETKELSENVKNLILSIIKEAK